MKNSDVKNRYEGKQIDLIVWPFYRYDVIMPEKINEDLFEWLYLSIVDYINDVEGNDKCNYNDSVVESASRLILLNFGNFINSQTLNSIIRNAEHDFVKKGRLIDETYDFLNTYKNLYSKKCVVKKVFQDAITGEILPYFEDTSYLNSSKIEGVKLNTDVHLPKTFYVKKAYENYVRLKKFSLLGEQIEVELSDEFYDEDKQTFLSDIEEFPEKAEQEINHLNNYNVIFLENTKSLFYLEVKVKIENGMIKLLSPFGEITDSWMNKCLKKACNVSQEIKEKISQLKELYINDENIRIDSIIENSLLKAKNDDASGLKKCGALYRLLEPLNDKDMLKNVIHLEEYCNVKNSIAYVYVGKILEGLIYRFSYKKTDKYERRNTSKRDFDYNLDIRCNLTNVDAKDLHSKGVYDDWVKKYEFTQEKKSFKADFADIIMKTRIITDKNMYDDFIKDVCYCYNKRNEGSHNDNRDNFDVSITEKLTKVTKIIINWI